MSANEMSAQPTAAKPDATKPDPTKADAPGKPLRWMIALAGAAWVAAWPILALDSTRGLPGVLGLSSDRGALELLSLFYTGPEFVLYAAFFLALLVALRSALGLAGALDRHGRAWAAIRWAGAVHAVRTIFVIGALLCIAIVFAPEPWRQAVEIAALCIAALTLAAIPFLSTHPATLRRDTDVGGWRLYWPGGWALVAAAGLVLFANLGLPSVGHLAGEGRSGWVYAAIALPVFALQIALELTASALWFGYRRRPSLSRACAALRRREFLFGYLGFYVYASILGALVLVPPIVCTAVLIYIAPHYQAAAQTTGEPLPALLQGLAHLGQRMVPGNFFYVLLPLIGWGYFASQRLVFRDGLSAALGPEAPPETRRAVDGADR